jgi:HTH-type transcriptional regulator/antitoxin HigA
MDIRPIKTEADYEWALAEIEQYFDREPEPGTPESQRFDVLASLIEHYENRAWPIDLPDPVEAIRCRMEQSGLTQADLARVLGSRSRASEILGRHRLLTKEQAFKLHQEWHIPAEVLIQPYRLAAEAETCSA